MAFSYQPLVDDEIRLVSLDYHGSDSTNNDQSLIACTIEHVRLGSTAIPTRNARYKGFDFTWPELSTHNNTDIIFRNGKDPCSDANSPYPSKKSAMVDEKSLPWRNQWGDFIALSYSWRPISPDAFITVNGASFQVTRNLYDALFQLRRCERVRQGFKLWIDAICINQGDSAECERQITRMREIYQSAWQVAIWIGPEADDSSLAFTALHWLAHQSGKVDPFEGFYKERKTIDARPFFMTWPSYKSPLRETVHGALFQFFSRAYWHRMWIIQEVAAGGLNTPVLCGEECISWGDLCKASQIVARDSSRLGRDILNSNQQQTRPLWPFDFAQDRQPDERKYSSERLWKIQITLEKMQRNQRKQGISDWDSLNQALTLVRDADATKDMDRVYGILGIKAVADSIAWTPEANYKIQLSELYITFTSSFLAAGNLSVLRLVSRCAGPVRNAQKKVKDLPPQLRQGSTRTIAKLGAAIALWVINVSSGPGEEPGAGSLCSHKIPSWAVCWTCAPAPTSRLSGAYQADASLGSPQPVFPIGGSTLVARGVIIDTIGSVSASNAKEADSRYPMNTDSVKSSAYGTLEKSKEALWRTIVGDTTADGGMEAPESYSWLLEPTLWQKGALGVWTYGFGLHLFMKRNSQLRLCGYTLEELIFGLNKWTSRRKLLIEESYCGATELQREALSWAVNAMAWRRVFGTTGGRMGMGTCATEVGDRVVVLRGCNTPLVLRESGKGWKLVGECYLHGIMYGEVVAQEDELIDIKIY
ncbi:hypothetical protein ACLX1H_008924 [Fusarium chlamydosporum]